jgi:hypothetical protein
VSVIFLVAGLSMIAATLDNDRSLLREDTRTRALAWVNDHIPARSVIVREDFTPQVPTGRYSVGFAGVLANHTMDFYRLIGARYLVASSLEWRRFTAGGHWEKQKVFYDQLLAMKAIYYEAPTATTTGPEIVIIDLARQE